MVRSGWLEFRLALWHRLIHRSPGILSNRPTGRSSHALLSHPKICVIERWDALDKNSGKAVLESNVVGTESSRRWTHAPKTAVLRGLLARMPVGRISQTSRELSGLVEKFEPTHTTSSSLEVLLQHNDTLDFAQSRKQTGTATLDASSFQVAVDGNHHKPHGGRAPRNQSSCVQKRAGTRLSLRTRAVCHTQSSESITMPAARLECYRRVLHIGGSTISMKNMADLLRTDEVNLVIDVSTCQQSCWGTDERASVAGSHC